MKMDCEPCALAKMHRLSFPKLSYNRSQKPMELIHSDLCGPMHIQSQGGSRYFLTFIDDYTRYIFIF